MRNRSISDEPEEMKVNSRCEMQWVRIKVVETNHLHYGSFNRPPDVSNPEYLPELESYLSRRSRGFHIWLGTYQVQIGKLKA